MALKTTHSDEASEIHISEGEALHLDFPTLLALVRKGVRIVIDSESADLPVAVISPPEAEPVAAHEAPLRNAPTISSPRKLSEVIALLPENSPAVMDADFARAVEEAIASHREPLKSAWD